VKATMTGILLADNENFPRYSAFPGSPLFPTSQSGVGF
jgi:hypothetical protein